MDDRLREAIDLHDRFTHSLIDRRRFIAELTRIAGGGAAAATLLSSIAANASAKPGIAPDDSRLATRTLELEAEPGRLYRAYQAEPTGSENLPIILLIHENRGLNQYIGDVARRLALAGYSAVAPDFLSPLGGTPDDEDQARTLIGELDIERSVADGTALASRLKADGSGKVGLVGFCWGGAMVNRIAVAAGSEMDAGVVFYGPAPSPALARQVQAPLLIHLAERDDRVNATTLPWIVALRGAGKKVRAIHHHGTDHAFHNDTSAARFDPQAASRAWAATLDFFAEHLRV